MNATTRTRRRIIGAALAGVLAIGILGASSTANAATGPVQAGLTLTPGTATVSQVYMAYNGDSASIFALGASNSPSVTTLFAHGNFDTVNGTVMWNPNTSTRTLPASLYYAAKPGWWPAGAAWPWIGPDVTPKVGTLQAQATSKTFNYKTSNNPSCTPNVGSYSCP